MRLAILANFLQTCHLGSPPCHCPMWVNIDVSRARASMNGYDTQGTPSWTCEREWLRHSRNAILDVRAWMVTTLKVRHLGRASMNGYDTQGTPSWTCEREWLRHSRYTILDVRAWMVTTLKVRHLGQLPLLHYVQFRRGVRTVGESWKINKKSITIRKNVNPSIL